VDKYPAFSAPVSQTKRPTSKRKRAKAKADKDLPLLDGKWQRLRGRAARASRDTATWDEEVANDSSRSNGMGLHLLGRGWNLLIGLSLLPFCWILTDAIFNAFANASIRGVRVPFWKTHEFLMFAGGATLWLVWFAFCILTWRQPRPLTVYVWGHELMHVLTARIFGGRIKDYEISRDGGYIVTDRYNFLIALAPYLWPFAAVPVLAIWGVVGWLPEALYHREWFLAALGLTWMFHLSFTAWMIPIGQTDFAGPGRIFSLGLIYLANVVLLSACMVALAPEVTWRGYWRELSASAITFYESILRAGLAFLERFSAM
jgi:hypothetical protein